MDLAMEQTLDVCSDKCRGLPAAGGVEQVRGLPDIGEGMEQIQARADLKALLGKIGNSRTPEGFLAVCYLHQRLFPLRVATGYLLCHPAEDLGDLRLRSAGAVSAQA